MLGADLRGSLTDNVAAIIISPGRREIQCLLMSLCVYVCVRVGVCACVCVHIGWVVASLS